MSKVKVSRVCSFRVREKDCCRPVSPFGGFAALRGVPRLAEARVSAHLSVTTSMCTLSRGPTFPSDIKMLALSSALSQGPCSKLIAWVETLFSNKVTFCGTGD